MTSSMTEKLRQLMGSKDFDERSRIGDLQKAEDERKAEESRIEAELDQAKRLKMVQEELEKTEVEHQMRVAAQEEIAKINPKGNPQINIDYVTPQEIRAILRPKESTKHAVGELAPQGSSFCPILALSKFPYKYMDSQSWVADKVSKTFFATEKFWKIEWSLYYIYPPVSVSVSPLILVPASEATNFLDVINRYCATDLQLRDNHRQQGLYIDFPDEATPRPRYLGTSDSKILYKALEKCIPRNMEEDYGSKDRSFISWKEQMEAALEATKNKRKRSKEKKQQQRILTKADWARQLRRTQRYLGLREGNPAERKNTFQEAKTAEEQEAVSIGRTWAHEEYSPIIDVNKSPLHSFDFNVIFISVDVEAYERQHEQITEIGLSILDTATLAKTAPGKNAVNWRDKVKGRHFIVKEYTHLVNSKYLTGCPDKFEAQFGVSEHISINDASKIIKSCFNIPDVAGTPRKVILVGHDIDSDINLLRQLDLDISYLPCVMEVLDTANLFRCLMRQDYASSLGKVLCQFEITGWNLHNAGNDAAYTLQALLAIAVHALQAPRNSHNVEDRINKAKEEAEVKVRESISEWEAAEVTGSADVEDDDIDDDDGGVPIVPDSGSSYVENIDKILR